MTSPVHSVSSGLGARLETNVVSDGMRLAMDPRHEHEGYEVRHG
jgi:hypothetical protein